jgi:hypothetical protein
MQLCSVVVFLSVEMTIHRRHERLDAKKGTAFLVALTLRRVDFWRLKIDQLLRVDESRVPYSPITLLAAEIAACASQLQNLGQTKKQVELE